MNPWEGNILPRPRIVWTWVWWKSRLNAFILRCRIAGGWVKHPHNWDEKKRLNPWHDVPWDESPWPHVPSTWVTVSNNATLGNESTEKVLDRLMAEYMWEHGHE